METVRVVRGYHSPDKCAPPARVEGGRVAGDTDRPRADRSRAIVEGGMHRGAFPTIAVCRDAARVTVREVS